MIILKRMYQHDQTVGIISHDDMPICNSFELPWRGNKKSVSCIPEGAYNLEIYQSPSKGKVVLLKSDDLGVGIDSNCERTYVEIHAANKTSQLAGCIAPCTYFTVQDGVFFGASSGTQLDKIIDLVENGGESRLLITS